MDGTCSGGGGQRARLSSPPFPERFYEFLGFDAPHLLQRNQSLGWHSTEVIILGRTFALLLVVPRQRLASQNCCGSPECLLHHTGHMGMGTGTLISSYDSQANSDETRPLVYSCSVKGLVLQQPFTNAVQGSSVLSPPPFPPCAPGPTIAESPIS